MELPIHSPSVTSNYYRFITNKGYSPSIYRKLSGKKGLATGYFYDSTNNSVKYGLIITNNNGLSWYYNNLKDTLGGNLVFWEPNLQSNKVFMFTDPAPQGYWDGRTGNLQPFNQYAFNYPFKMDVISQIFKRFPYPYRNHKSDITDSSIQSFAFPNLPSPVPDEQFPTILEFHERDANISWPSNYISPLYGFLNSPTQYICHRFSNVKGHFFRVQKFDASIYRNPDYGVEGFGQYVHDTTLMYFATNANAPVVNFTPDTNYGIALSSINSSYTHKIYPSVYLSEDRILVEGTNATSGSPGLCRIGTTHTGSLKANRWPALKQWYDNAPCYWCKTFNRDPHKLDTFTKVSFCDSLNGFAQTVDNMNPDGTGIQMAIYSTTDGGETWQNGTRFNDTNLVTRPFHLIACAQPGVCYFITDVGKLFKTLDYGKTWTFQVVKQHPPFYRNRSANQQITNVSATDTNNIWISFGDSLITTGTGGDPNWQPYTNIDTVNNVRLYTPGRINTPMIGTGTLVLETHKQNTGKSEAAITAWYDHENRQIAVKLSNVNANSAQTFTLTDILGRRLGIFGLQATDQVQSFPINLEKGVYLYQTAEGSRKLGVW